MTWQNFYLTCFLIGLLLSFLSLLGGMGRLSAHLHLPHSAHLPHAGHFPHAFHVPHAAHTATAAHGAGQGPASVPWWNSFSIMIFLCWFGAAGYLLARHSTLVSTAVLLLAIVSGVAGGVAVFLFLSNVMLPHEHELSADETPIVGVVGTVSCAIAAGGTGEIIYEQLGARRSAPARSEDRHSISKDDEVYVVRYDKGIVYVRRWEEVGIEEPGTEISSQSARDSQQAAQTTGGQS